jgi:predicted RNA-binding Zn ribbon-like protein
MGYVGYEHRTSAPAYDAQRPHLLKGRCVALGSAERAVVVDVGPWPLEERNYGMTWPASERYRLEAAPAGLALVQDLLNTLAAGKPREPDLLGDLTTAKNWIGEDLSTWARERDRPEPQVEINEHDLDELRVLRGELQDALRTPDRRGAEPALADLSALHSASAGLRMNRDSRVSIEPRGTGWRYIACLVLMEALEAQQTNVWNRLKICRNPRCSVAFFDRSRNNSGVWHSTRVCGNIENLRAHRARARARASD